MDSGERLDFAGLLLAEAKKKFEEAVEDEAEPSEDEQSPVEAKGFVARGRGQMRHEDEEVEETAEDDGGELFKKAGHGFVVSCQ